MRLGDYYVYMCVKEDLAAHVKKSVKYIQVDILFKTRSIELPNQNKKDQKKPWLWGAGLRQGSP